MFWPLRVIFYAQISFSWGKISTLILLIQDCVFYCTQLNLIAYDKKERKRKGLRPYLVAPSSNFLENFQSNFFLQVNRKLEYDFTVKTLNSYIKFGWVASVNRWVGTYPNYFSRNCAPRSQGAEVSQQVISQALNELRLVWKLERAPGPVPLTDCVRICFSNGSW